MPCQYYTDHERHQIALEELSDLKQDLDDLTRLLCSAVKRIPKNRMTKELQKWKDNHEILDKKRKDDPAW